MNTEKADRQSSTEEGGTVREEVNKSLNHEEYEQAEKSSNSHMGAQEEEMEIRRSKPPTQSLAELTHRDGQAAPPEEDEYNPGDEITPG